MSVYFWFMVISYFQFARRNDIDPGVEDDFINIHPISDSGLYFHKYGEHVLDIIRCCWLIYDGLLRYIIKMYVNFADSSSLENHTAFSQLLLDQRMW